MVNSNLCHPNICTIPEIDDQGKRRSFITMRYIDRQSLKEHIGQDPLGAERTLDTAIFWEALDTKFFISDSSALSLRAHGSFMLKNTANQFNISVMIIRKIRNYSLTWPLILTITYENNLVFVENEMPNIWGEGDTLEEAKKSFEHYFLYEFESYKNTPLEKMDYFAQEELKLYKALLGIS